MCIIVAKDKITPLPKDEYLKNCFDNNPDGAGFMYIDNNSVVIDKGYMTYKSFKKHYKRLCRKYNNFDNKSLIMHFRIGTAGANSKQNTHPYPVTYDKELLHKTYYRTTLGMAHNGIISQYNPDKNDDTTNDTQNFIMKYVYPLYKHYPKFYKNKYIMDGLEDITGSKLAFMTKDDTIYLVGKFETDESGVKYSNTNYLPYTYKYAALSGYHYYPDYYYDNYKHNDYYYDKEDTKSDKEFIEDLKDMDDPGYETEIMLEPKWYYSVNEKNFESVGDKELIYDFYYNILYEVTATGDYEYLGNDVMIFDENGEEMIF